jgi:hypothetical protein
MGESGRRTRWLRRIGIFIAGVVVLLMIAHIWWGHHMAGVIAARIEALHAAGEPILPADFETAAPGNDPGNSAPDIEAAIQLVDPNASGLKAWDALRDPIALPLRDKERVAMQAQVLTLGPAMTRLEVARDKPRLLRTIQIDGLMILQRMPELNPLRALANGLNSAALLEHEQGDDAAAITHLRDVMLLSRYCSAYPNLIAYLVGVGCATAACDKIEIIAPDLRLDSPAGASLARMLIDELMDDAQMRAALRLAFRSERMQSLEYFQQWADGKVSSPIANGRLLRPLILRNAAVLMDYQATFIGMVDQPDLRQIRSIAAADEPRGYVNRLSMMMAPSARVFETHFKLRTDAHLAAAALAIRWYAGEHEGRLPASLDELVPKYLARVPEDPFSPTGSALGYRPIGDQPILYSVGVDAIDAGGSEAPVDRRHEVSSWNMVDRVLHLKRQPRPAPLEDEPATEADMANEFIDGN